MVIRRALVTGAAGFIGSHLCEALVLQGTTVIALDDLSFGRADNLSNIASSDLLHFVTGDVADEGLMHELAKDCTHIYHLAAHLGASLVERQPVMIVAESIKATRSVVRTAEGANAKLFYASTSEIYGDSPNQPLNEQQDLQIPPPSNPRSSYALAKAIGELHVNSAMGDGLQAVIGRLFNVIGERQSGEYGAVVPRFVSSALRNLPLEIQGDGNQTRSFTSVHDAVRAIQISSDKADAFGRTINIGTANEISVNELAAEVISICNSSSDLVWVPYEKHHPRNARDIMRRAPDLSLQSQILGLVNRTSLRASLAEIRDWLIRGGYAPS